MHVEDLRSSSRTTLAVLSDINLLDYLDRYIVAGTVGQLKHEFDTWDTQVGLPMSIFLIRIGISIGVDRRSVEHTARRPTSPARRGGPRPASDLALAASAPRERVPRWGADLRGECSDAPVGWPRTIRIAPWQLGHASGSTSKIYCCRVAHRRDASVGASGRAGTMAGGPSAPVGAALWRMPRGRLAYQP